MRTLTRKTKKQIMRKEKTHSPKTVAKKFLRKAFISNPFIVENDGDTSDKNIALVCASVGINYGMCQA
jgi:hypothetical protein